MSRSGPENDNLGPTFTSGQDVADRQCSYNTANQISQIVELPGSKAFGYDNIDRLTSVTDAVNRNESFAFDAVGNRISSHLSTSYTYQPFNRMTATQTVTLDHDVNG
jgi:YD repeat-containing protein